MTDAELDRLEQLANEATPKKQIVDGKCPQCRVEFDRGKPLPYGCIKCGWEWRRFDYDAFVDTMQVAVPQLVAEVRRLRKLSTGLLEQVEKAADELEAYRLADLTRLGQEIDKDKY